MPGKYAGPHASMSYERFNHCAEILNSIGNYSIIKHERNLSNPPARVIISRNSRMEENHWSLRTITGLFIYNANGFIQLNEHINKHREEFPEIYQDRDPK